MIYFLQGKVHELTPTYAVLDVQGVGYYVGISLQTSEKLVLGQPTFLYIQQIIREDANLLFGFHTPSEKEMFNLLISVNGVGAVSALILLSSISLQEIASAIQSGNSGLLQKVKGVGTKTAERIIVDLRDKLAKFATADENNSSFVNNKVKEESLYANDQSDFPRRAAQRHCRQALRTLRRHGRDRDRRAGLSGRSHRHPRDPLASAHV